jgi:hypothetical protein
MGSAIDNIVDVTITKETATATAAAFNTVGVMAEFESIGGVATTARHLTYASYPDVISDGWLATDPVALVAKRVFAQPKPPSVLHVGRRDTSDASWTAALAAIQEANDDWYGFGIIPVGTTAAAILAERQEVRDWADTQVKLFVVDLTDVNILDATLSTDDATLMSSTKSVRTALIYHGASLASEYLSFGLLSRLFGSYDPGAATAKFRSIAGSTADLIKVTKKSAAWAKKANTYCTVAGTDMIENGFVCSGEWVDVVVGLDWLKSDIQTTIFSALATQPKLPYTTGGIQAIGGLLKASLLRGAKRTVLDADSITITLPSIDDITSAQKHLRALPDVKFSATLQGAIQGTVIAGTVTD